MSEMIYSFNGKDITLNVCIQIRAVVDELQKNEKKNTCSMIKSMVL